jgi:hypothetical protein
MKPERIYKMFNALGDSKNLIAKALNASSSTSGGTLPPEFLAELITETVNRLSPQLAMLQPTTKPIPSNKYRFNRITAKPNRGGAMGEKGTTPTSSSSTEDVTLNTKVVRRKGSVTNFLKDATRERMDTVAFEMQNNIDAHVSDLINYLYFGNKNFTGNYEHDGLEVFISSNRNNQARGGVVPTSLGFLDSMIDTSNRKKAQLHRRAFMMSPEMLSKVSQLLTNVRLNQGLSGSGLTQVEVGGGWRLNAYRDIPIIETTQLAPVEQMLASTITLTTASTGGALSDATYYVQIAPITHEGEQLASAEKSITLSGGTSTQVIKIALSTPHQTGGNSEVYAYKIYIATTTNTAVLADWVSAFLYDANGAVSGDNGVGSGNEIVVTKLTGNTSVPSHMQGEVPLNATASVNPENIILWDMDAVQGLGDYRYMNTAGSAFNGLITTEPLDKVDDFINFLTKSYPVLADRYEETSVIERGYRTA